ncbi:uracil-DNA glycosylase family protein [Cereibacter sphaeroides]|jgi:hypothetical protein|uniref:uracil-DNA glycosylase family protein n=1 Tax=Cereibacter sphaeroides TaxID=1063 RepID=UPI00135BC18C
MTSNLNMVRWEESIRRSYEERLRRFPDDPPLGWRLLYSPRRVLTGATVAFIGLNPGGAALDPTHGEFSSESGSAYRRDVESWGRSSGLQDQVIELFKRLGVRPDDVLAGNLVPFRSPGESTLRDAGSAIAFGRRLWTEILEEVRPKVVISMGGTANREISSVLKVRDIEMHQVGWGNHTASRGRFSDGTWVGLPHLSRFAIMKREASQSALDRVLRGLT